MSQNTGTEGNVTSSQSKSYLNHTLEYVKQIPWTEHATKLSNYFSGDGITHHPQNDDEYDAETAQLQLLHLKNKDELLWSEFMHVFISTPDHGQTLQKKTYFVLAYSNGFQVYEVAPDAKSMQEIVSKKDKSVKFAKVCILFRN
jgi:hypothetical protein